MIQNLQLIWLPHTDIAHKHNANIIWFECFDCDSNDLIVVRMFWLEFECFDRNSNVLIHQILQIECFDLFIRMFVFALENSKSVKVFVLNDVDSSYTSSFSFFNLRFYFLFLKWIVR